MKVRLCSQFDRNRPINALHGFRVRRMNLLRQLSFLFFTALHAMQTRSSDDNSIRPSVCLSHAWIVTKRKKDLSRFLYHMKDHLA